LTLDEFICKYLKEEDIYFQEIQSLKRIIEEGNTQKREFEAKKIESETAEQLNEHGIMSGSVLVVQVREATRLPGAPASFAEVIFDQQHQTTQIKPYQNRALWNEKFSFDVITGKEILIINVCSNEFAGRNIIGTCQFFLNKLQPPEYNFDDWTPLKDQNNKDAGQIKVSLQWIYSRVEFFKNLISKLEAKILENENELKFCESRLSSLHRI